jgi:hypothetical protein
MDRRFIMIAILSWAVAIVLLILSGVHWYWLGGGRGGLEAAIPSTGEGSLFRPSQLATAAVAILLLLAAWFVLELGGRTSLLLPDVMTRYGGWLIAAVFILRAIGDFNWLGFFKRRKGTVFARWDSLLYSPLCLFLGLSVLLITLSSFV